MRSGLGIRHGTVQVLFLKMLGFNMQCKSTSRAPVSPQISNRSHDWSVRWVTLISAKLSPWLQSQIKSILIVEWLSIADCITGWALKTEIFDTEAKFRLYSCFNVMSEHCTCLFILCLRQLLVFICSDMTDMRWEAAELTFGVKHHAVWFTMQRTSLFFSTNNIKPITLLARLRM